MMEYESEMQKIVYEVFGDELRKTQKEIETMKKELQTSKETIKSKDENIKNLQDSNRKLRSKLNAYNENKLLSALKQLLNKDDSSNIEKAKVIKIISLFDISQS